MKTTLHALILTCLLVIIGTTHAVDPPGILNHQGRITVNGVNHDGAGFFKFALVDGGGTTTFWSNDGTSAGGGKPAGAVEVTVVKGQYAVPLGDTGFHANMTNAIAKSVFAGNADVRLRIWFATAMGGPFEQLSPDRRVASTGYSLSAGEAAAVAAGALTGAMIANGAVTTAKIAAGAVDNSRLAKGAAGENIDAAGALGIGLGGSPPAAAVQLDGSRGFVETTLVKQLKDGVDGFNFFNGARSVCVSGTLAYVTGQVDNTLSIIDVSTPSAPVRVKEIQDGVDGFNGLGSVKNVLVSGTIAYVTSGGGSDQAVSIIDVTNPISPVLLKELRDEIDGFNELQGAFTVAVSGTTAYVASFQDDSLTIIDVTNPSVPVLLKELKDGVDGFNGLNRATSVVVSGNTAYVAAAIDDALSIIDVTKPAEPVLLAEVRDGVGGFNELNGASWVFVSGTTAYVVAEDDDALTIIDVSTPAAPKLLAEVKDGVGGFNELNGASSVFVAGTTAYVTAGDINGDDALTIIDVTNPAAPALLGTIKDGIGGFNELDGAEQVFVSGTTAYVTAFRDDSLTIVDVEKFGVDLATSNRVGIGTAEPEADLHVAGDALITGGLLDASSSSGMSGQFLTSTGTGIEWSNGDHGLLSGLADDDHPQYFLGDGAEDFTGDLVVRTTSPTLRLAANSAQTSSLELFEITGSPFGYEFEYSGSSDKLHLWSRGFAGNEAIRMTWEKDGHVGIGAASPEAFLHVADPDASNMAIFERSVQASNGLRTAARVRVQRTAAIGDGTGPVIGFEVEDNLGTVSTLGQIGAERIGADNAGDLVFRTANGGSPSTKMRLERDGDLLMNGNLSIGNASSSSDDRINFDAGFESLNWDNSETQFEFSDDVAMAGALQTGAISPFVPYNRMGGGVTDKGLNNSFDLLVSDDLEVNDDAYIDGDISIGTDSGVDDDVIYFDFGTAEFLFWDDSATRFVFSDEVAATVFTPTSDRNAKEEFAKVNAAEILEKVAALPVTTWNFKGDETEARHIGPVAQDFFAAFGVGADDRHISTTDADGVAFAAIQALNAKMEAKDREIEELKERLEKLERVLSFQFPVRGLESEAAKHAE